jgi:heme exporter protein C
MCAMNRKIMAVYWLVTAALFTAAVGMVFIWTPVESTMGIVQKVFYLHLPVAINTFMACMITFIAGVGYLWQRRQVWDDLAVSSAKIAVLLCSVVLLTGMIWGHSAWGVWWTWSPRLTFSLVLWLLYVAYLVIRPSIESRQRRALVSAVYAVVAFLDVPLVYLSVKLMPEIHPSSITLAPEMKLTLLVCFVPVTMLSAGLIVCRFIMQREETRAMDNEDETQSDPIPVGSAGGLT